MSRPTFLTESVPPRGVALAVAAGVRRIVAANPGPYTYHGTNTYLLGGDDGVTVVDPGPDDARHVQDVQRLAGGAIRHIVLTHHHRDHAGAAAALAAASGAAVLRFADGSLQEGGTVDGWTALHTPGHAADHLCLFRADGVMLTGDHVMSFSSSVVIPPDGAMAAYMESLRRLLDRQDTLYLPGHGPPINHPHGFVAALLAHRQAREAAIIDLLQSAPRTPAGLVVALYHGLDPKLHGAAEASVTAHLRKLADDGVAVLADEVWRRV